MIGSHKGPPVSQKDRLADLKLRVEIDVIQIEEGRDCRIRASPPHMRPQIGEMELRGERARDEAAGPFVEIPEDDARTGNVRRLEEIFIHQQDRLRPPLAVRCSKVHVENVHQMRAYADVGAQSPAFFPAGNGKIYAADAFERPAAERDIAIHAAAMFAGFSNGVKVSETVRQVPGLVLLNGQAFAADHLLQGDDIGADFFEDAGDAFDANPAIQAAALVNIVGGNPEAVHGYT